MVFLSVSEFTYSQAQSTASGFVLVSVPFTPGKLSSVFPSVTTSPRRMVYFI